MSDADLTCTTGQAAAVRCRPRIVVLAGYGRTGKDTVAETLVARYGFVSERISDPIKVAAVALDPIVGSQAAAPSDHPFVDSSVDPSGDPACGSVPQGRLVRMSDLITDPSDDQQWNAAKESEFGDEVVRFLQALGDEASREVIGVDVWAAKCAETVIAHVAAGRSVVVSGVRFWNEAEILRSLGALMVRVNRDGYGPVNGHRMEVALDAYRFDLHVQNRAEDSAVTFAETAAATIVAAASTGTLRVTVTRPSSPVGGPLAALIAGAHPPVSPSYPRMLVRSSAVLDTVSVEVPER